MIWNVLHFPLRTGNRLYLPNIPASAYHDTTHICFLFIKNFRIFNKGFRCIEVVLRALPQNGLLFKKAGRPFMGRPVVFVLWFSWMDRPHQ